MLRFLYALDYYGLGMDAFGTGCSPELTLLWFGHGCSGNCTLSQLDIASVWAWMLRFSYAPDNGRCYGLGMDAFGTGCSRNLLWFGHGCSGNCMLSQLDITSVWAWMLRFSYALGNGRALVTSAWQPSKVYPPKALEKTSKSSARKTPVVVSSVLFSLFKTVSAMN